MALTIDPTAAALLGATSGFFKGSGYRPYPVSTGEALSGGVQGLLQGYGVGQQLQARQQQQQALQQLPGILQTPEGQPADLGQIGRGLIGLQDPQMAQMGLQAIIANRKLQADRAKTAAANQFQLKSADSNTLYRGAASIFDATFDANGNLSALDPTVRPRVQALWALSGEVMAERGGKGGHGRALSIAAQRLRDQGVDIPEIPGGFKIPAPGDPSLFKTGTDSLLDQAQKALAAGRDREQVIQRFIDQGGDPAKLGITPGAQPGVGPGAPVQPATPQARVGPAAAFPDIDMRSLLRIRGGQEKAASPQVGSSQQLNQTRQWFDSNIKRFMRPEGKSTGLPFTTHQPMNKNEAAQALQRLQVEAQSLTPAQRLQADKAIERLSRFLREQ